ncbi:PHD finger protein 10 [Ixodes scapularis]|uniref:PHD finger protein 10 n=1 Tax=Ixodes scapularis TaxID=6945 RepID=UPI0011617563|nr:PHD finger protein 10 [Ixodes scapularis]
MSDGNAAWAAPDLARDEPVEAESPGFFPSETAVTGNGPSSESGGIFLEPDVPKLSLTGTATPSSSTLPQLPGKRADSDAVSVFEEDTRSSWNLEPAPAQPQTAASVADSSTDAGRVDSDQMLIEESEEVSSKPTSLPSDSNPAPTNLLPAAVDCDSQNSASSAKSGRKKFSDDEVTSEGFLPITADKLFEYQWPHDGGDAYMLQEQVCEYLHVKSFKRKHPDLYRRPVEFDEKEFLKERGVVTETQCDLGLTALRADDVVDLFMKDYPEKYQEYANSVRERDKQNAVEKHKGYSAASIEKCKMADFVRKAVASTAEYNQHLNQERREERRSCFDLQTFTIQYPTRKTAKPDASASARRRYPVALIPGQYQDHYRVYTAQELKYLPVNTVLYGPPQEIGSVYTHPGSDGSQSESEDSSGSDGSSCSSSSGESSQSDGESGPVPVCKVCNNVDASKEGEELISCSECGKVGHVTCLDILPEMAVAIKSYRWQCMECKMCNICMATDNEEKMMFCDRCDRGYHSFCVGMKSVPAGRWICRLCGRCATCGVASPGPEGPRVQWHHEYGRGPTPVDHKRSVTIYCQSCYRQRKGR